MIAFVLLVFVLVLGICLLAMMMVGLLAIAVIGVVVDYRQAYVFLCCFRRSITSPPITPITTRGGAEHCPRSVTFTLIPSRRFESQ